MTIFQKGEFTSHAGLKLPWKIECDGLSDEDWETLAFLISERCQFGEVYGIPRGGVKLAKALEKYANPASKTRLVVDDVYTTGKSMVEAMNPGDIGFVVFARNAVMFDANRYVRSLFTMMD